MNYVILFRVVRSAHLHCETQGCYLGCSGVACELLMGLLMRLLKLFTALYLKNLFTLARAAFLTPFYNSKLGLTNWFKRGSINFVILF